MDNCFVFFFPFFPFFPFFFFFFKLWTQILSNQTCGYNKKHHRRTPLLSINVLSEFSALKCSKYQHRQPLKHATTVLGGGKKAEKCAFSPHSSLCRRDLFMPAGSKRSPLLAAVFNDLRSATGLPWPASDVAKQSRASSKRRLSATFGSTRFDRCPALVAL